MSGDVVKRCVEIGAGQFAADTALEWLADIVRSLRTEPFAACGNAGTFTAQEEQMGTVEINPVSKLPVGASQRRNLHFTASDALTRILMQSALTDDLVALLENDDPIASAFGKALAQELVLNRRASIGNFGVWSVGQKPNLQRFVRFRPRPAINQML